MNKSFVLSGGRKNDRFESGFKPATLPDWQNGNVSEGHDWQISVTRRLIRRSAFS
jgi:hypothetical protein